MTGGRRIFKTLAGWLRRSRTRFRALVEVGSRKLVPGGLRSISTQSLTVGIGAVVLGGGLIAAGWLLDKHVYASSLLQNSGVAVLLLVPLFFAERILSHRFTQQAREVNRDVAAVESRISSTATTLDELSTDLNAELGAAADADSQLADDTRLAISLETLGKLFDRACELKGLSEHGLRVAAPHQWERFRFSWPKMPGGQDLPDRTMRVSIEGVRGDALGIEIEWAPNESAVAVLAALAESWKRTGSYPGDAVIDPQAIFPNLIDSLDLVIQARRLRGEDQLSPLIEKLSEEWALTDYGLEHLSTPYWIRGSELVSDLNDWRRHMREKTWVVEGDERAKAAHEPDFWMASEIAKWFFDNHPFAEDQS